MNKGKMKTAGEIDRNTEIKIKDLIGYYVDRYGMYKGQSPEQSESSYNRYKIAITRIIQNTEVAGISLWEIIHQKNSTRKISVNEFEKFCAKQWFDYIINNEVSCSNETVLRQDIERYNEFYGRRDRFMELAKQRNEATRRAMETGEYYQPLNDVIDPINYENSEIATSSTHEFKALYMMTEAILDILGKSFDMEKLKHDMEMVNDPFGKINGAYDDEVEGMIEQSRSRLGHFGNYIREKKE